MNEPEGQHHVGASVAASRSELPESLSWKEVRRPLTLSSLAVVALLLAGFIGAWSARSPSPDSSSIEAGYARDTSAHHAQGVKLSFTALQKTSSPDVRDLAQTVINDENREIGRTNGLLSDWHLSEQPDGARMAWMRKTGHQHSGLSPSVTLLPDGRMPGTASPEQIRDFTALSGRAAEVQYLQLMLLHDGASIEMSQAVRSASSTRSIVKLADSAIDQTTLQMRTIRSMLRARGTAPWNDAQAGQPLPRV